MKPGPRLLGRALRGVVWKGRDWDWESSVRGDGVGFESAKDAAAGSTREVRAEAERPARIAGTIALCAVVSDMIGRQPHICLCLTWWWGHLFAKCVLELSRCELSASNGDVSASVEPCWTHSRDLASGWDGARAGPRGCMGLHIHV